MATVLHSSDILDYQISSALKFNIETQKTSKSIKVLPGCFEAAVGNVHFNQIHSPFMQVTDIRMEVKDDLELHNFDSVETININFFISGHLDTQFKGLSHDLNMRPKNHNIVYAPQGKNINRIKRNQNMEMLHISLDKDFFRSCLGNGDAWSDRIMNDLEHSRAFSGNRNVQEATPQMVRLIDNIRNCRSKDPMRNLLVQSRVLELLALQMEQFHTPSPVDDKIRQDEAEKLYQLKHFLDANFLSELSLEQLSRICLLNEFKIKKGFKLLFETTVFGYLRKLRMEYAGNLLRDCSLTVDEVADILGYEHSQHFSVAFKKWMGVGPKEYKS